MPKAERQKKLWSASRVRRILRDAEESFSVCWGILDEFKEGRPHPRLIEFQGLLAEALFKLSAASAQMGAERNRLIPRKADFDRAWFRRRLKSLASYQQTMEHGVSLGKSLGDAFAWFFYQNDVRLLEQHLSHPLTRLMPTGTGGLAELEIARAVHHMDGKFIVHHCVTTLLRIGDISLVEHRPLRVISIGEIKAGVPHGLSVDVDVLFRAVVGSGEPSATLSKLPPAGVSKVSDGLTPRAKQRQARQIRRMDEAVTAALKPFERISFQASHAHYWDELRDAIERSPRRRFSFTRLGGGLMVAVYRHASRSSLSSRLFGNSVAKAAMTDDGFEQSVGTLIVPRSLYNSLVFGSLHYSEDGWPRLHPGTQPLFWWSLPPSIIRDILFGSTVVVTLFNPAPLIERLRSEGFTVDSFIPPGKFTLSFEQGVRRLTLGNVDFWLKLVPYALFREEQVVEVIRDLTEEFFAKPLNGGTVRHSDLRFVHSLFPAAELEIE